jgi:hypothetical protein
MYFKGSVGKMASMQLQVLPIAYFCSCLHVLTAQSDATANDPLNVPALIVSPKPGYVKI